MIVVVEYLLVVGVGVVGLLVAVLILVVGMVVGALGW